MELWLRRWSCLHFDSVHSVSTIFSVLIDRLLIQNTAPIDLVFDGIGARHPGMMVDVRVKSPRCNQSQVWSMVVDDPRSKIEWENWAPNPLDSGWKLMYKPEDGAAGSRTPIQSKVGRVGAASCGE